MASHKGSNFGKSVVTLVLLASSAGSAWSQYVWLDDKGVRQYSDRPPPPSVPQNRIVRPAAPPPAPASLPAVSAAKADASAEPAQKPQPAKAAPTIAERNAEFNKRRAEQAEKDKKAAEQERLAADKARSCERAASYKRNLESGARISKVNANGETAFLTDEQREQELKEAARLLQGCTG